MSEGITRQNLRPSLFVRAQEERLMDTYSAIKPYLVRLFTHALLLFISVRAYENFKSSQSTYQEFINLLSDRVVIDAKRTDEICENIEGGEWRSVKNVTFPNILKGCRCEDNLFIGQSCDYISGTNPRNPDFFNQNCRFLDFLLEGGVKDDYINWYVQEGIIEIPPDFLSKEVLKPKYFDYDKYNQQFGDIFYKTNNLTNQTIDYRRNLYNDQIEDNLNTLKDVNLKNVTFLEKNYLANTRLLEKAGSKNLTPNSKFFIYLNLKYI